MATAEPHALPPQPTAGAPVLQRIRLVAVALFLLGVLVQFYLAGRGVFGASSYKAHKDFGDVLHLFTAIILILTLVTRTTRNGIDIGHAVLLLVLFEVQFALATFKHPDAGAFHPVNGLLILAIAYSLLRRDLRAVRGGAPASA